MHHQQLAQLRECFASNTPFMWQAEWPAAPETSPAGVLIALQASPSGLEILLTRRTDHLYHHPGQISFPGGRQDAGDSDPIAAALREAQEEIGLAASQLDILGSLPDYVTSSGFRVCPVVAYVKESFDPALDSFEVAELFGVPLAHVLKSGNFQRHRVQRGSESRHFFAVPYPGHFIWGATAGMLAMFAAFANR